MSETVSVDLGRALRLSTACLRAAIDLRKETDLLLVALREAGGDPFVLGQALRTSEWAAGGTRRIAALVEAVVTWNAAPSGTCGTWAIGPAGRVADQGAAMSAAAEAIAALRAGRFDLLAQLMVDWSATDGFAEAFGSQLGLDDVIPWLVLAGEPGAETAQISIGQIGDGFMTVLDVVGMLAAGLSAATVARSAPFDLEELLEVGARLGLTPIGAAMLFAAPGPDDTPARSWSRSWLVDATRLLVVPLTAQMRTDGPSVVARRWGDVLVDPRTPILEALAGDPAAARAALVAVDLASLVGASARFLDGGAALAAALVVATAPGPGPGQARGAGRVMGRFIDALSTDDPPMPLLADRLGEIAAPWIGAFRVDRADARTGGLANPLPEPDEVALRRYLHLASESPRATGHLIEALDAWVSFSLATSGPKIRPEVLHDLGAVNRFVSEATRDLERSRAAGLDQRQAELRQTIELFGDGVGTVASTWWGQAAGLAITKGAAPRLAPDLDAEIEHLASVPAAVARDQELLEWQVLAHLWRHRVRSGLFDGLAPPPSAVLDQRGQLAARSALDDRAWNEYRRWRDAVAAPTGVDNVGAAFGRDLAPSATGPSARGGGGS